MGFFDGLAKGLSGKKKDKEILDMVNDEDEEILSSDYRSTGLDYSESNNGMYTCVKCGRSFPEGDIEIDHIIPRSMGGTNSRYNLQCMCIHCNRSKRNDMSDTEKDLSRRKKELDQMDKDDLEFMKYVRKNYIKKDEK